MADNLPSTARVWGGSEVQGLRLTARAGFLFRGSSKGSYQPLIRFLNELLQGLLVGFTKRYFVVMVSLFARLLGALRV